MKRFPPSRLTTLRTNCDTKLKHYQNITNSLITVDLRSVLGGYQSDGNRGREQRDKGNKERFQVLKGEHGC